MIITNKHLLRIIRKTEYPIVIITHKIGLELGENKYLIRIVREQEYPGHQTQCDELT